MIKRFLAVVLFVCMVLCSVIPFASAGEAKDTAATSGVDVVVVLDMSQSMKNPNNNASAKNNDASGFRLDATSMLIGMMDMDGSRVAIVPFAGYPFDVTELTAVNDDASRSGLLSKIYNNYNNSKVKPDTNIGAALMKANEILEHREDKTNQPMIVLMTDGTNDCSDAQKYAKVQESWRWKDSAVEGENGTHGTLENEGSVVYETKLANEVTREAVGFAADRGFQIYTVALNQNPDETPTGGMSLRAISQATGLDNGCWYASKNNAKDLPSFFAEVLADKIGSSVQNKATPEKVEGTADTYRVSIPILNKSVLETNVIIPVNSSRVKSISGIDAKSIQIIDAEGTPQTEFTGVTTLVYPDYGHFALVKIREPKTVGMWTLQFRSGKEPADIVFNILYNYDIQLTAGVTVGGQDQQIYKNDKLLLRASFVDREGKPSGDDALYADPADHPEYEEWMHIRMAWALHRVSESGLVSAESVAEGTLTPLPINSRYETTVDLSANPPLSGTYLLRVRAEGAGLNRTVEIPVTLLNHEPVARDYMETINVNTIDEGAEASWTVEGTSGTLKVKAGEIVTDEDGDTLVFNLLPKDGVEEAADLTIDQDDGTISFRTKADGDRIRSGLAEYILSYSDEDTGKGSVTVTLNVVSDVDVVNSQYEPEITVDGTPAAGGTAGEYLKNTPLTVTVRMKNKEAGGYGSASEIPGLGGRVVITDAQTGDVVRTGALELKDDVLEYVAESTGNRKADWKVTAEINYFEPVSQEISIPNHSAPVAVNDAPLTLCCDGEKVPGFLGGIIGKETAADNPLRTISTHDLFTDADNDQLEYSLPVFLDASGEALDAEKISTDPVATAEDGKYLINFSGNTTGVFHDSFSARLVVTATDGDGQVTEYTRSVTVVDLYNRMMTYLVILLIAIVLLIILILIIHQIRKPRFPMLNMTIREEPSLFESGSETLSPVKTPTNANAIGVDSDMAAKHNISMELLQNIIVRPVRSRTSVGVACKKMIPGHEVMLEDVQMKAKKHYIWRVGQELSVRSQSGEGLVAIKLEDRSSIDSDSQVMQGFGGDGDWSAADQEQTVTSAERRHSRKVERKNKPAQEETFSGGNDDFDF